MLKFAAWVPLGIEETSELLIIAGSGEEESIASAVRTVLDVDSCPRCERVIESDKAGAKSLMMRRALRFEAECRLGFGSTSISPSSLSL